MAFISLKTIKGKKRYYLEKSIRLSDNKIKKISVYLKNYGNKNYNINKYKETLNNKVTDLLVNYYSNFYKKSEIFDENTIKEIEKIRIGYKELIKKINKKQFQDIIDRFTVNFTYESNAIEGSSLTLKDVTFILHENKTLSGKDLREVYETLNTREAIKLIFNNKLRINENDIIKLHKILVKNTQVSFGYKKLPNFLLNRNLKTIPPEKVKEEMDSLIDWYNKTHDIHPLERAAIFHGKFEKIHPFEDGNGRVGRLLIDIMLINNNYPPLIIRKTHRISYFNALEAFDNGYAIKLNRFLIEKYKDTYEKFFKIYVKYLKQ